jgi:hypothetical protein
VCVLEGSRSAELDTQASKAVRPSVMWVGQAVRSTAVKYHPFGTYHFILGEQARTPPHADPSTGRPQQPGGIGDAGYADLIRSHLDVVQLWKSFYASSGR